MNLTEMALDERVRELESRVRDLETMEIVTAKQLEKTEVEIGLLMSANRMLQRNLDRLTEAIRVTVSS